MSLMYMYKKRAEKYPKGSPIRNKLLEQVRTFRQSIDIIRKKGLVYTVVNGEYMELPRKLHIAANIYKDYFNEEIRGIRSNAKKGFHYELRHRIFCKYAMELGCTSRKVDFLMGAPNTRCARRVRTQFTRSFADNPEYKKAYHDFLQVAKQRQNEQ